MASSSSDLGSRQPHDEHCHHVSNDTPLGATQALDARRNILARTPNRSLNLLSPVSHLSPALLSLLFIEVARWIRFKKPVFVCFLRTEFFDFDEARARLLSPMSR